MLNTQAKAISCQVMGTLKPGTSGNDKNKNTKSTFRYSPPLQHIMTGITNPTMQVVIIIIRKRRKDDGSYVNNSQLIKI